MNLYSDAQRLKQLEESCERLGKEIRELNSVIKKSQAQVGEPLIIVTDDLRALNSREYIHESSFHGVLVSSVKKGDKVHIIFRSEDGLYSVSEIIKLIDGSKVFIVDDWTE
jgi:hypothetical protein